MKAVLVHRDPRHGQRLEMVVQQAPRVSLIACARDLSGAYTLAEHKVPDLVLLEAALAELPEFEVLVLLFQALRTRCVLIAPEPAPLARHHALATRYGLACVTQTDLKPLLETGFVGLPAPAGAVNAVTPRPLAAGFDDGLILLGASTGGVDALIRVLSCFPKTCPATVIVQHTGAQFTGGLARLIGKHVAPTVTEAVSGAVLMPGCVLIAPGGSAHLVLTGRPRARVRFAPRCGDGHCPSVDRLFMSAVPYAGNTAAAVLTGMGRDGAEGLLALRQAGAKTFAQDAASSIVYGMPKAAMDLAAADEELPLDRIGPALLNARRRACP